MFILVSFDYVFFLPLFLKFMEIDGFEVLSSSGIFKPLCPNKEALVTLLQIASHLVRNSEEYLDTLMRILTPGTLASILCSVSCSP